MTVRQPRTLLLLTLLAALPASAVAQPSTKDMIDPSQPRSAEPREDDAPAVLREGISGRVTAPGGLPIAGAFIEIRALGSDAAPIPDLAVLTDDRGVYRWHIGRGRYAVRASHPNYGTGRGEVDVRDGAVSTLNLMLRR